jgi:hypothetical protein
VPGLAKLISAVQVALVVAVGVSACGDSGPDSSDIAKVKEEASFPILWLGTTFEGNRIHDLLTGPSAGPYDVFIAYGDCTPRGEDHPSCSPPVELQEQSATGGFPIAGRPILYHGPGNAVTYHEGGGIVILSGRTYVKIFADRPAEAARTLRPIGQESSGRPLPAPAAGVLDRRDFRSP